MKKLLFKPSFEFVFSLSLIVILGLPPMLMAQNQKDLEITIQNGDTTVNGKNIKELSAKGRQDALKDINHLNNSDDKMLRSYTFKRRDSTGGYKRFVFRERMENGERTPFTADTVIKDSLGNIVKGKQGRFKQMGPEMAFRYRMDDDSFNRDKFSERNFGGPGMKRFDRRNSQNFDYVNIDNDGIRTHVRFHVSEVSNEDLKRIPHVEGAKFEIEDLNIVPEFSTGKTLITFNLTGKSVADVKLMDSDGKLVWNEKFTNGRFIKSFVMGLNGIYYLQIKQGNSVAMKRILKEE
ncbi:MAG TPA: T9SS type A sorting domain-containing protein [Mucilaginibacter sp.]|jgi:hypothetical protein